MGSENIVFVIVDEIKKILLDLGFEQVTVGRRLNYVYNNVYCIPNYLKSLGFFIEYAHSREEAEKNWHEDGDSFPISMGREVIIASLESEIKGRCNFNRRE